MSLLGNQAPGRNSQVAGAVRNAGAGRDNSRKRTPRERFEQRSQQAQQAQRPVRQNPNQNQWRSNRGWGDVAPSDDQRGPSGSAQPDNRWQQGNQRQRWEQPGGGGQYAGYGQQEYQGGTRQVQPSRDNGYAGRDNGYAGRDHAHADPQRQDRFQGAGYQEPWGQPRTPAARQGNRQDPWGAPRSPLPREWQEERPWGGNASPAPARAGGRGWGSNESPWSGSEDVLGDTGGGWGAAGYAEEEDGAARGYAGVGSAASGRWNQGEAVQREPSNRSNGWPEAAVAARPSYGQPGQGWRLEDERGARYAGGMALDDGGRAMGDERRGRGAGAASSSRPWEAARSGRGGGRDAKEMNRRERVQVALLCNRLFLTALEQFNSRLASTQRRAQQQDLLMALVEELAGLMSQNEACLDAVNVSTALQCLATAATAVPPMGDALEASRRLVARLGGLGLQLQASFKMDTVTMTVSSYAKLQGLGSCSPMPLEGSREANDVQVLMEGLAVRAWQRITQPPELQPHEMAVLVWAYSRMGIDPLGGKLFALVQQKCEQLVGQFTSQNISNFLIAAVLLDKPLPPTFLQGLAQQAVLQMPRASPQGVANLLWAFAKLTNESMLAGDLFRAGVSTALEMVEDLSAQNVANILWAVADVEHPLSPRALRTFVAAFLNNLGSAGFVSIAGVLASYKKIEGSQASDPLIVRSIKRADEVLEEANLQALGSVLWTLGSFGVELPADLLRRLDGPWAERALTELYKEWGGEAWGASLAMILWGYSKLRLDPLQGRLFQDTLARLSGADAQSMQPQNLSNILLAAATVQRRSFTPDFLNHALAKIVAEGTAQSVCNSLWALTALGLLRGPAIASLVQRLQKTLEEGPLNAPEARQLLMAHSMYQVQNKEAPQLVPQALLDQASDVMANAGTSVSISEFHSEVSATLEAMKVAHAVEFQSPDGLLSIDLVARCGDGNPLALEVDGELHFTTLPPYRPLGHTVLRNQLIAANGFRGVGVPFYDWVNLDTLEKRVTYLSARLNKWGIGDVVEA